MARHALLNPGNIAYDTWIVKPAHHLGLVHIVDEPLQRYRRHTGNAPHDVISRQTRVSRLDGVRAYHRDAAVHAWRAEIRDTALITDRLQERAAVLAAAGWSDGIDPAVARLRGRTAALDKRALAVATGPTKPADERSEPAGQWRLPGVPGLAQCRQGSRPLTGVRRWT